MKIIEQLGVLSSMKMVLVVVVISVMMLMAGYLFFLRDKINTSRNLQRVNASLEQQCKPLVSKVHQKIPRITLLKLMANVERAGLVGAMMNETEPIVKDKLMLCQFSINALTQFDRVMALLNTFKDVGVKSLDMSVITNRAPLLSVELKVYGICDKK